MKIGFIGLGRMGRPISFNLLKAGFQLCVFDVSKEALNPLAEKGAEVVNTVKELAEHSEIVITCLPGPKEVEDVMAGQVLPAMEVGGIAIDLSTVGPSTSLKHYKLFAEKKLSYLDAPISGGIEGAEGANLAIMVGGDRLVFEKVQFIFKKIGQDIQYLGQSGSGNGMKLIIQLNYMCQLVAFFEGIALGDSLGLKLDDVFEILSRSSARHPTIEKRYDKIRANDLEPRFELRQIFKDLSLARDLGKEHKLSVAAIEGTIESLSRAINLGFGEKDAVALRTTNKNSN